MTIPLVILCFLISVGVSSSWSVRDSAFDVPSEVQEIVGEPLYLTSMLEEGKIVEAQQKASVHLPNLTDIKSFSGYFTVNKECESNLFFWFFPAQDSWENAHVVLWLQGGPGDSSLIGVFDELGPISFSTTLEKRPYSWNVKNNLLFIDQPVGTGFSFTRKRCYVTNETEVSRDLYSALLQFYQLFPPLQKNKFFVAGESYGGHFVPSIAYAIHQNNPSAKFKINLSGLMIGNGLMDVMYQSEYSNYLYQLGLVDNRQRDNLLRIEKKLVEHLKKEDWESGITENELYIDTINHNTGADLYNFLKSADDQDELLPWQEFITTPRMRNTLRIGNNTFESASLHVGRFLRTDIVQSVKPKVEELLEDYPVVFYNGQLDIICAYPMAVNFFRNLQWSGARDYLQAERQKWCVEDVQAGYFKSAHNLHEVLVRAAGHSVPQDQPLWAFDLMNSVTSSPAHDPLRMLKTCGGIIV